MKYLKKFEGFTQFTMYGEKWKNYVPNEITIIKDKEIRKYHRENTDCIGDLVQINYVADNLVNGDPDEMEIDIYMIKKGKQLKLDVDITYGDLVVSEFSVEAPHKVSVIQYTSYGSKFDPSNTVFAFEDESLQSFITFLNNFDGFQLTADDFKFLDKRDDNYIPE